jgi:SAM-dependent methyltransferase
MDISPTVIELACKTYALHRLPAKFQVGDAYNTGLPDCSFDIVVSIGLLEHLEDLSRALAEQVRLLDTDGLLLAYVVPENPKNVQKDFRFICEILALYDRWVNGPSSSPAKQDVYRSSDGSKRYLELLAELPMRDVNASGVYPLPMISPSVAFPFTLMPTPMESILVRHLEEVLAERARATGRNPWLCEENFGQAFLVWGWRV